MLARAVNAGSLADVRDVGAVIDSRVRQQTQGLVPQPPKPWAERVPEDDHQERHEYLADVGRAMDEQQQALGEYTARALPGWAERALGPVPDDPEERQAWQDRASAVASYREMFAYSDPKEPIGPEPVNSPEARQMWHAAFNALGPVDGPDLRALSDGQLLSRRDSYERETAWAPRWVSDELRQVRTGAADAERDAVLSAAMAEAARKQEQHELARLHEDMARSQEALAGRYRGFEEHVRQDAGSPAGMGRDHQAAAARRAGRAQRVHAQAPGQRPGAAEVRRAPATDRRGARAAARYGGDTAGDPPGMTPTTRPARPPRSRKARSTGGTSLKPARPRPTGRSARSAPRQKQPGNRGRQSVTTVRSRSQLSRCRMTSPSPSSWRSPSRLSLTRSSPSRPSTKTASLSQSRSPNTSPRTGTRRQPGLRR